MAGLVGVTPVIPTQEVSVPHPEDPEFTALISKLLGKNSQRRDSKPDPKPEPPPAPPPPPPRPEELAVTTERRVDAASKARIELARRRLSWFVRLAFANVLKPGEKLEWGWYLDVICDHVQSIIEGWFVANGHGSPDMVAREEARWALHKVCPDRSQPGHEECAGCKTLKRRPGELLVQNMAFNISPGTLKSVIIMVCAPAWAWLHVPTMHIGATSGSPGNVTRDSDAHRDLVRSSWYRESFAIPWEVRADIDAKELWSTTAGGSRLSRGMVAKWTGVHVDMLLCDDPDDAHAVFGEPARRDVQGKWTNAIGNRVNSLERSIRLLVQQHVHTDDLSSHLCNKGAWTPEHRSNWGKVEIPMEFNPHRRHVTPYGWTDPRTEPGAVMHPERFPRRILDAERTRLGSYGYEAQYNQAPEILDGGMFQRAWFRFFRVEGDDIEYRARPPMCRSRDPKADNYDPAYVVEKDKRGVPKLDFLALTVDASFGSTKNSASNVSFLAIGGQANRRFIFDDRTKARTFLDTKTDLIAMIQKWKPSRVLIEKKANGAAVMEELQLAISEASIKDEDGHSVLCVLEAIEPKNDGGSKEARAAAAMPSVEAGLVYLLDGAAWNDDFVGEIAAFPNGRKDDRVDALTQALNFYRGALSTLARWEAMASF